MGANIIITEVNEPKTLTDLDELKTPKVGGGYEYWVRKSDTKLTTKHISKNGTYSASADGYYGFKSVTVNVPGGSGSADSSGKPSGTILPGGAGSAIVGEDEDGNDAVIGVDEQGKIVKTPIPSYIEIITPPTKTEYNEGDDIDCSGLVVGLKKKDGTTFTDARYPNGHIPMGELIFPVAVAPEGSGESQIETDLEIVDGFPNPFVFAAGGEIVTHQDSSGFWQYTYRFSSNIRATGILDHDYYTTLFASSEAGLTVWEDVVDSSGTHLTRYPRYFQLSNAKTIDGKTVFYAWGSSQILNGGWVEGIGYHDKRYPSGFNAGDNTANQAWAMIYGTVIAGGKAEIPVQWRSPYDGRQMEDKFEITVTSAPEGSGGGGTF